MSLPQRLTFILAVVAISSTAGGATQSSGAWDPGSKRYGKTTVTLPPAYYTVDVDVRGNIKAGAGSQVTVAHEEGGICQTVGTVSARFDSAQFTAPTAVTHPNGCNFTRTFDYRYPLAPSSLADVEKKAILAACSALPAGATKATFVHPLLKSFVVQLDYPFGFGSDRITYAAPVVAANCERCPPVVIQQKPIALVAGEPIVFDIRTYITGGVTPIWYDIQPVPGMKKDDYQDTVWRGNPFPGTWVIKANVLGSCKVGPVGATGNLTFIVQYKPILLVSSSATPSSLSHQGGAVKLEAKFSSEQLAVKSVRAKVMLGSTTAFANLTLAAGTTRGESTWRGYFYAPENKTTAYQKYTVAFEVSDDKGQTALVGNQLLGFQVGPMPAAPPSPTPLQPTKPPAPPPIVPKLTG